MDARRINRTNSSQKPISSADGADRSTKKEPNSTNRQALGNVITKVKLPKNPLRNISPRIKTRSEKKHKPLEEKSSTSFGARPPKIRSPLGYELLEATEDTSESRETMRFPRHDAVSNLPARDSKFDSFKEARPSKGPRLTNIVQRRVNGSPLPPIQLTSSHASVVEADQHQQLSSNSEKSTEQSNPDDDHNSTSASKSSDINAPQDNRSHLISHFNRDLVELKERIFDNEIEKLLEDFDELTAITNSYIDEAQLHSSPPSTIGPQFSGRRLKNTDSAQEEKRIAGKNDKKRLAYKEKTFGSNDAVKITTVAQIVREEIAQLNQYLPYLPAGVTLNPDGTFDGTYISHSFPEDTVHVDWLKSIEEEFTKRGNNLIDHEKLSIRPVGGVNVVHTSEADFRRAQFQIPRRNGEPHIDGRFTDSAVVARALREFTGNDNVTIVLSSLMNQEIPGAFIFAMQNQSGGDVSRYLRIITPAQARQINKDFKIQLKAEGMFAKFKLSRSGEDYKITVTLDALLEQAHEQKLPMRKDQPMEVHFETEIIVNAEAAREGVLKLNMSGGIKSRWKGRLDSSLVK